MMIEYGKSWICLDIVSSIKSWQMNDAAAGGLSPALTTELYHIYSICLSTTYK